MSIRKKRVIIVEEDSSPKNKSYTSFSDLTPYTTTIICNLNRNVDLKNLFYNLPYVEIKQKKKRAKKVKIDVVEKPGSIISLRYIDDGVRKVRGFERGGYFNNCITIDMSIFDKNINIKLFKGTVHFTGCRTEKQAKEGVSYLINHIKEVEKEELIYNNINTTMRNYNYELGFSVDRKKLCKYMNGNDIFFANFDPSLDQHGVNIKILIPSPLQYTKKGKIKKTKPITHTFIVFREGSIVQSSKRNILEMEKFYYKFRDTLLQLKDQIELK